MKGLIIRLAQKIYGRQKKAVIKQCFRVECNFGCKYFKTLEKGKAYFKRKADKHLDVELWLVTYFGCEKKQIFSATQDLLAYSGTEFTKG